MGQSLPLNCECKGTNIFDTDKIYFDLFLLLFIHTLLSEVLFENKIEDYTLSRLQKWDFHYCFLQFWYINNTVFIAKAETRAWKYNILTAISAYSINPNQSLGNSYNYPLVESNSRMFGLASTKLQQILIYKSTKMQQTME